jgi:ethanolamine utilization protein EutP (predicted NTPase)
MTIIKDSGWRSVTNFQNLREVEFSQDTTLAEVNQYFDKLRTDTKGFVTFSVGWPHTSSSMCVIRFHCMRAK